MYHNIFKLHTRLHTYCSTYSHRRIKDLKSYTYCDQKDTKTIEKNNTHGAS
jgi:hypothetical protein